VYNTLSYTYMHLLVLRNYLSPSIHVKSHSSNLKMKMGSSPHMLVSNYQTRQCHIPDGSNLNVTVACLGRNFKFCQ
jgi:hypothetical protein